MSRKLKRFFYGAVLLLILNLIACSSWTLIEKPELSGPQGLYSINAPLCWVHASVKTDAIVISKDGPGLNLIEIKHYQRDKGLPLTKKKLADDLLVTEVAELFIAELKKRVGSTTFNHLSTEPADIDGKPGFKLSLEVVNTAGLKTNALVYGLVHDKNFYYLLYRAPQLYYFERDRQAFEDVVASFTIKSPT